VPGRGFVRTHRTELKGAVVALFIVSPFVTIERTRGYVWSAPPPHPLAGLYEVRSFAVGGRTVRPIAGDSVRWRRVVISNDGTDVRVQLMNYARLSFAAALDTVARRVALSGPRPIDVAVTHVA